MADTEAISSRSRWLPYLVVACSYACGIVATNWLDQVRGQQQPPARETFAEQNDAERDLTQVARNDSPSTS